MGRSSSWAQALAQGEPCLSEAGSLGDQAGPPTGLLLSGEGNVFVNLPCGGPVNPEEWKSEQKVPLLEDRGAGPGV